MNNQRNFGPDFIGIGMAKSGTTWTRRHLVKQPNIYMGEHKEFHYLSRMDNALASQPKWYADAMHWLMKRYKKWDQKNLWQDPIKHYRWYVNYHVRKATIHRYGKLFRRNEGMLSGEFTPDYIRMPLNIVEKLYYTYPNVKILLSLRDPVERSWSWARFRYDLGYLNLNAASPEQIIASEKNSELQYPEFYSHIDNWLSTFPREQIYIYHYDRIQSEPEKLLNDIGEFIGLNITNTIELQKRVNESSTIPMPSDVRKRLIEIHRPKVEEFMNRDLLPEWNPVFQQWLEKWK